MTLECIIKWWRECVSYKHLCLIRRILCAHICVCFMFFSSSSSLSSCCCMFFLSPLCLPSNRHVLLTQIFFHTFEHSMGCNFRYGIYIFRIRFAFMHMRCHTHSRSILSTNDTQREVEKRNSTHTAVMSIRIFV